MKTAWLLLFLAGLLEAVWAIGMKYSDGFTRLIPSVITIVCLIVSFILLTFAMKQLPVGTAYAIWTGIGAFCTCIAGIILFNESAAILRLLCLFMIVAGIVGLKFLS